MKKIILALGFCLILMSGNSFVIADEDAPAAPVAPVTRLGIEGGFTFGNLTGEGVSDVFGSRFGIVGGLYLNVPLRGTILGFQPEFL